MRHALNTKRRQEPASRQGIACTRRRPGSVAGASNSGRCPAQSSCGLGAFTGLPLLARRRRHGCRTCTRHRGQPLRRRRVRRCARAPAANAQFLEGAPDAKRSLLQLEDLRMYPLHCLLQLQRALTPRERLLKQLLVHDATAGRHCRRLCVEASGAIPSAHASVRCECGTSVGWRTIACSGICGPWLPNAAARCGWRGRRKARDALS